VDVPDNLSVVIPSRARDERVRRDVELRNRVRNSAKRNSERVRNVVGRCVDGDFYFEFHCVPFLEHTPSIQQFGDTRNLSLLCAFDFWPRSHLSDEPLDIETGDNE
jgi:hypothetical protein